MAYTVDMKKRDKKKQAKLQAITTKRALYEKARKLKAKAAIKTHIKPVPADEQQTQN